jgi:hypothetical protein
MCWYHSSLVPASLGKRLADRMASKNTRRMPRARCHRFERTLIATNSGGRDEYLEPLAMQLSFMDQHALVIFQRAITPLLLPSHNIVHPELLRAMNASQCTLPTTRRTPFFPRVPRKQSHLQDTFQLSINVLVKCPKFGESFLIRMSPDAAPGCLQQTADDVAKCLWVTLT